MLKLLEPTLSQHRLSTYLIATGHDEDRALELYVWNARLGESFHLLIQAVEIALRNRIDCALTANFGPEWWRAPTFLRVADARRCADIEYVGQRIGKKGLPVSSGQIVAGLSFGFWVAMLDPRYNPMVWSGSLRSAFPYLPASVSRNTLQKKVREIAAFRNRIWHHEPVFKADVTVEYARCLEVLGWLCPNKCAWIKPKCRVMAVMREKP